MRRIFGLFCVLVFSVFLSLLFIKNNTYAVSDISVTVSSGTYNTAVFPDCDSTCLKQYQYLIVESNSSFYGDPGYFYFIVPKGPNNANTGKFYIGGLTYGVSDNSVYSINQLPFNDNYIISPFLLYGSNFTFSSPVTFTLTNDLGSCPEPEPPEPCPDPEENSRFIQVVLDAFWKYHQVFGGAVVAIIVIFFVYRLIKGVMR